MGKPIPPHKDVHYNGEHVAGNKSGDGSNKDGLDAKPANESTEHDKLKNAVCETIRAQDVTDITRSKAKTADIYRHGEEMWLDSV